MKLLETKKKNGDCSKLLKKAATLHLQIKGGGGGEAAPELGGAELGGGEAGGAEAGGGEAGGELPPLEEETRKDRERGNRDQTGNKEKYTSSHTKNFGEDPLGKQRKQGKIKNRTQNSSYIQRLCNWS